MVKYPEVQDKVHEEIQRQVGSSRPVYMEDKLALPYTQAVLQEIMRFTCIGPLALPHAAQADIQLEGGKYLIPKGTCIFPNLYRITRNARVFTNPTKFMPERFLSPDGKYVKNDQEVTFGVGKRDCLGKSLALTEFFLFFANLMQRFHFTSVFTDLDLINLEPRMGLTQTPHPFEVVIEKKLQ